MACLAQLFPTLIPSLKIPGVQGESPLLACGLPLWCTD